MSDCILCKVLNGELPGSLVYEDDLYSAFMDIQPVNPGHILLIPKRHIQYVTELTQEEAVGYYPLAIKITKMLKSSNEIKVEGVNFFLADGEAAMQEIFHTHLHIIPRFHGDGFGLKFSDTYSQLPQREHLDKLANHFKELLYSIES